jgi:hypothetical protein
MPWEVKFDDLFEPEFDQLAESVQDEILELRFNCDDGKWRVAFAFDPKRTAILLVAGNKVGADQQRFYEQLISTADARFDTHLTKIEQEMAKSKQGKGRQGKGKQGKGKQGKGKQGRR